MGTWTIDNFRAELLFDLRNRTDRNTTDGVSDDRLDAWINAGQLHVTHPSVFRHRELMYRYTLPLVAGTSEYVFTPLGSTNITAIRYVSHVDAATDDLTASRTKLLPKDIQWFQGRTYTTGAPREYHIVSNRIVVGPVPSAAEVGTVLAVGAWAEPRSLSLGFPTDLSTLWDEIILLAARWRAELHLGYRDLAEATKLDFVGLINEYKDFEQLHGEDWDWMSDLRTEPYMESA